MVVSKCTYLVADLCHDLEIPLELLKEPEHMGNGGKNCPGIFATLTLIFLLPQPMVWVLASSFMRFCHWEVVVPSSVLAAVNP